MAECQFAKTCPFYSAQAKGMTSVSAWLRTHYCRGNFVQCARHTVQEAMGDDFVPADLYPNEIIRAHQILSRANLYRGGVRRII